MNILSLPESCFYEIIKFLYVDERLKIRCVFERKFPDVFKHFDKKLKLIKSIGISNVTLRRVLELTRYYRRYNEHKGPNIDKRSSLFDRWHCSNPDHWATEEFSGIGLLEECTGSKPILIRVLEQCPLLESLDLRGLELQIELIEEIRRCCPNLICLQLDFARFGLGAFDHFFITIYPKIRHLSADNLHSSDGLNMTYNQLSELQFSFLSTRGNNGYRFSQKLKFVSLNFYLERHSDEVIKSLRNSSQNLHYLKIKYFPYDEVLDKFRIVQKFPYIKALNLNMLIYDNSSNTAIESIMLKNEYFWFNLKSFTYDFRDLDISNHFARLIAKFCPNLIRLRLISFSIEDVTIIFMVEKLRNLYHLELCDVKIKEIRKFFCTLILMDNLEELCIEYSIQENYLGYSKKVKTTWSESISFPNEEIDSVELFIEKHPNIKMISFYHWPNLERKHVHRLQQLCREKNVQFKFQE